MKLLLTLALALGLATPAFATKTEVTTEHTVEMWNQDPEDRSRRMVFSDELVEIAVGDTVNFLATDKGHNVEFVYSPEGAEVPKRSKINDDVTVTFDTPGVYVYVCTPHATMGMIGVVVVGEVSKADIEAALAAKVRGSSKKKLETILSELD